MEALYEKIFASLERLILLFVAWYRGKLSERAKVALNSAEEVSETLKAKLRIKDETRKLSDAELARRTVIDD